MTKTELFIVLVLAFVLAAPAFVCLALVYYGADLGAGLIVAVLLWIEIGHLLLKKDDEGLDEEPEKESGE